jgi:hypothetical protein
VAFEATFNELVAAWRRLHEVVEALRVTTVEDKPLTDGVLLVDRCGDATEDLLGWATEGLAAATNALGAVGETLDLNRARRALSTCQQCFARLEDELLTFTSYDHLTEINRFGRKRRGEWLAWVRSVRDAAAQCLQPTMELREALVRCWQELAERLGTTSVSVQTTNVGQQISTPPADARETTRNGPM